jgi:hypothetical protein
MFSFTFGGAASNVPEGSYYAEFQGVEEYEDAQKRYEPGVKWTWRVTQPGEHQGKTLARITGQKPTPNNACGKMIIALLGRTPKEGDALDLTGLVGKRYLCQVVKTTSGGVRVENVTRLPD